MITFILKFLTKLWKEVTHKVTEDNQFMSIEVTNEPDLCSNHKKSKKEIPAN